MHRSSLVRTGLIFAALLALSDLSDIFQPDNPEPIASVVLSAILGGITLIAAVLAWRGSRTSALVVVVTRAVDAVGGLETFVVHGFHNSDRVATVVATVLAVVSILLITGWLRSGAAMRPWGPAPRSAKGQP